MKSTTRLLAFLALVTGLWFMSPAPVGDVQAFAPGDMPMNLAAYELAEEPDYAKAKLATMRLETAKGVCSATAIGHHRVLTASHCVEMEEVAQFGLHVPDMERLATLRLGSRTARVSNVHFDRNDAVILTTDIYFTDVAGFGPKPKQGDVVFSHGNPASTPDILLVGRVAGWVTQYGRVDDVMLLDRNDWYGCSGAAVFDRDGRVIGIVNAIFPWPQKGWRLTAVFPLTFAPDVLEPQ